MIKDNTDCQTGLNLIDLTYFWNDEVTGEVFERGLNLIDLTYFWN